MMEAARKKEFKDLGAEAIRSLEKRAEESVRDALMLHPEARGMDVARSVAEAADEGFLDELGRALVFQHFLRLIRAHRSKAARDRWRLQLRLLPGFEDLPRGFVSPEGQRVRLEDATYTDLGSYLKAVRARQRNAPQVGQIQSLMDLLKKWRKKLRIKGRGLTVAEAMEREARARDGTA
jgi:hypothetical protein